MNEENTVKLLKECDAGIIMGISAIDDVLNHVKDREFHDKLFSYKQEYNKLLSEIQELLYKHKDVGKDLLIAKSMAWVKTNIKLGLDDTDKNVADIMTDGCNMGIKTLVKFMNRYADADNEALSLAKRLLNLGERQVSELRAYL